MSFNLPSFSKKVSKGVIKSSVQLAKNALKRTDDATPRLPVPILSIEYLKIKTVKIATPKEKETNNRNCISDIIPMVDSIKKTGINTRIGCSREEKITPPNFAKDVTDKTSSLSIKAPLKPKKKNLIQRLGDPRIAIINPPRRSTPNHINEEKNDKAEQRLRLKIKSCLIEVRLTIKSETSVKRKKIPPKPKPTTKLFIDKSNGNIDRIPPCKVKTPK